MADRRDIPNRVWCGPDSPAKGEEFLYSITLNSIPPDENVYLKAWSISKRLAKSLSGISLDLLEIAAYVYSADQSRPRGGKTFPQDGKNWYRQFELSIPVRHPEVWNNPQVTRKLSELLRFMADDDYKFVFRPLKGDWPRETYFKFEEGQPWFKPDSVLLFSGGLDSLTGVIEELQDQSKKSYLLVIVLLARSANPRVILLPNSRKSLMHTTDFFIFLFGLIRKKGLPKMRISDQDRFCMHRLPRLLHL